MEKDRKYKHNPMEITWEQQKVISNPLRSRMIALLYEQAMTPKQVANLMGKNPGTTYYHIQQLVKHGILEVENINTDKGIVEKFYRAKAMSFKNTEQTPSEGNVDGRKVDIYLSDKLRDQLSEELEVLMYKYGHLSYEEKDTETQNSYSFEYLIQEFRGDEDI
ncbi:ArsR/SmtB family transcription factor [Salinicoccus roseus]|uniref:ArsR/SmtB family transcription factor n=1 Tax=Salinicoccus roseus TaxID=45670 RepID=UPI002301BC81|nr:helix-turn-helix domain-containing protein [Salinicoccus roseus]